MADTQTPGFNPVQDEGQNEAQRFDHDDEMLQDADLSSTASDQDMSEAGYKGGQTMSDQDIDEAVGPDIARPSSQDSFQDE
jgi:hypothetical protein